MVATVTVAVVAPCGTVTLGIVAANSTFELESVTVAPPAPAGAVRVIVAVEEPPLPPAIVDGLNVSDAMLAPWKADDSAHKIATKNIAARLRKYSYRRSDQLRNSMVHTHPFAARPSGSLISACVAQLIPLARPRFE